MDTSVDLKRAVIKIYDITVHLEMFAVCEFAFLV